MSRDVYEDLLAVRAIDGARLLWLGALARAGRARRLAFAMAEAEYQEGLWVSTEEWDEQAEDEHAPANRPMIRLAADEQGPTRFALDKPVRVQGAPEQAVTVQIDPTSDGAWLLLVSRLGPTEGEVSVLLRGEGDETVRIAVAAGEDTAQTWLPSLPTGELVVSASFEG